MACRQKKVAKATSAMIYILCVQNYAKSNLSAKDREHLSPALTVTKLPSLKSASVQLPSLFALGARFSFYRFRCRILAHSPDDKIVKLLA